VDHTLRQGESSLTQGGAGGVRPGDLPQQVLQPVGTTDPLQVPHQGKRSIRILAPAKALVPSKGDVERNRLMLSSEIAQGSSPFRTEAKARKRLGKTLHVLQDCWQDGEMGQGDDALSAGT
jgi:hypothetical protein